MKRTLFLIVLLGLSACTALAPPKPPCCSNAASGMRPINPEMISSEHVATWEQQKKEEQAAMLKTQEEPNDWR